MKFEKVYYVASLDGAPANPVAIRPEIYDNEVVWQDTSKGKIIELGSIPNRESFGAAPPDLIEIVAKDGRRFRLEKLTLDIYNKKVKERVMLPPTFTSDEEVQNFYLTSDFEIY